MSRRQFKGSVVATSLASACTSGDTTLSLVDGSTFPSGTFPFVVTLDLGLAGEEKVLAGARSGNTLSSVTRGFDGTAAASHASGTSVRHTISAVDLDEANAHVNATSGVHGVAGAVVGTTDTQTLTGKTLTSAGNPGVALTQAQTHGTPDTDAATTSLHHTLGASATQAAAGNHTHGAGLNQIQFGRSSMTVASGNGTLSVTFGTAFATTPRVVASSGDTASGSSSFQGVRITNQSTTGFTASVTNVVGGGGTNPLLFDWIAVA